MKEKSEILVWHLHAFIAFFQRFLTGDTVIYTNFICLDLLNVTFEDIRCCFVAVIAVLYTLNP